MATAVLEVGSFVEVEPKLREQADDVLNQLGMSLNGAVNLFLRYITFKKELPSDMDRPPIPCVDDMTEEELIAEFEKGMADIKAGHYHTAEEVRAMMESHYVKF